MTRPGIKTIISVLSNKISTSEEQQSQVNIEDIIVEYSTQVEPEIFTWICRSVIEGDYIGQSDYKSNLNDIKKDL